MPWAPKKVCAAPACGRLTSNRFCDKHEKEFSERKAASDHERGSAASRGYGHKWRKAREGFLKQHPLCQCDECQEGKKRVRAATVVDHIVPHKGDMQLFWDKSNWQALADECHRVKSASRDGAFGNPMK
jgi:5-methylcytosine-specific restriction protein A